MKSGKKLPKAYELGFSPNGQFLVTISGNRIQILDVKSLSTVAQNTAIQYPNYLDFSPDGKLICFKTTLGRIYILETLSCQIVFDHRNTSEGEGTAAYFSPCGEFIIDGSWNGYVNIRSAIGMVFERREFFSNGMVSYISHARSKKRWLFQVSERIGSGLQQTYRNIVSLVDWPFSASRAILPKSDTGLLLSRMSTDPELSPDGCTIAFRNTHDVSAIQSMNVNRWSVDFSAHAEFGGTGNAICWSHDGRILSSIQARKYVFYRPNEAKPFAVVAAEYPSAVAFHPDGERVALGQWRAGAMTTIDEIESGRFQF